MLIRAALAILVAVSLAGVALAQSSQSSQGSWVYKSYEPQKRPQDAQNQTAPDNRGTEKNPVIVDIRPPANADEIADRERKEAERKALIDNATLVIGGFTVAALFLQLAAFITQACYMRNTVNEMRGTTVAAIRAARASESTLEHMRAATEKELRAHVFATYVNFVDWRKEKNQTRNGFRAMIYLENTGVTPARNVYVIGGMCVRPYVTGSTDIDKLDLLPLRYDDRGIGRAIFGPKYGRFKSEFLHDEKMRPRGSRPPYSSELRDLDAGVQCLFVYGEIQYLDEFDRKRWSTYCFITNREIWDNRVSMGDDPTLATMASFQRWNDAGAQKDRHPNDEKPGFCELSVWLDDQRPA